MKKFIKFSSSFKALILTPALLFSNQIFAQTNDTIMVVKGGPFFINFGGIVQVNGKFANLQPTNIDIIPAVTVKGALPANNIASGKLFVAGDFINFYTCGDAVENNGEIHVQGDWENNDVFLAANGTVFLDAPLTAYNGGNQHIGGTDVTTFNNLTLDTFGVKILTTNQIVVGKLDLRNSELAIDTFEMFVNNPLVSSVDNILGFASTIYNHDKTAYGKLHRVTNNSTTIPYRYPMGSSIGTTHHYRPVEIKPEDSNNNRYSVAFINDNVNNYGFTDTAVDTMTICRVNPDYFFNITREDGLANANITLTYNPTEDGNLSGIINWQPDLTPASWKNLGGPFPFSSIDNLTAVTKVGNFDWNVPHKHFNLGLVRPNTPVITGPLSYCGDFNAEYSFTPYDNVSSWEWDAQMGNVIGDSTTNPVTIVWKDTTASFDPTQGTVKLIESLFGCNSLEGTLNVTVLSNPIANFNITSANSYNPSTVDTSITNVYTFDMLSYNNTSTNTQNWNWNFGDSDTSALESPFHYYENIGEYPVYMVSTSPDGCIDTAFGKVTVVEGTTIPNAFTPNNDGFNDVFYIRNSNISEYDLKIYDRWGILIYKSTAPQIKWDGNTIAGQPATGGTYFWVMNAKYASGNEYKGETKGYVELVRN